MTTDQLKERTKNFALRVIRLFQALPESRQAQLIGAQLVRSGMAVGARYWRMSHLRSKAELVTKLGAVIKEVDESAYWLELLVNEGIVKEKEPESLLNEAHQLSAIFNAAQSAARKKNRKKRS